MRGACRAACGNEHAGMSISAAAGVYLLATEGAQMTQLFGGIFSALDGCGVEQ